MTGEWWYWFHDRDWWLSVVQGALGAVISLMGLFMVYKATQLAERRKQNKERTLSGVAAVLEAAAALRHATGHGREEADALANQLMLFALHEFADRRDTGRWALELSVACTSKDRDELRVAKRIANRVTVNLIGWVTYVFHEGLFTRFKPNPFVLDEETAKALIKDAAAAVAARDARGDIDDPEPVVVETPS